MKLGYRIIRNIILLVLGVLSLSLQGNINGFSIYFGIAAIISAGLTLVYLFLHFDETIDREIIIEMLMDGFSGLVIFTYPQSDNQFFIIVFSFWIAIMGILIMTSGMFDKKNKEFFWLYALLGISLIVAGYSIMHVTEEAEGILSYYIGFILIIYSGFNLWLIIKRKQVVY